jgi:hypothetical protein
MELSSLYGCSIRCCVFCSSLSAATTGIPWISELSPLLTCWLERYLRPFVVCRALRVQLVCPDKKAYMMHLKKKVEIEISLLNFVLMSFPLISPFSSPPSAPPLLLLPAPCRYHLQILRPEPGQRWSEDWRIGFDDEAWGWSVARPIIE